MNGIVAVPRKNTDDVQQLFVPREEEIQPHIVKGIRDGETFLDIGANAGFYAIKVATMYRNKREKNKINVVAIEPNQSSARAIIRSARYNGFKNFTVINKAATDYNGTITLFEECEGNRLISAHSKTIITSDSKATSQITTTTSQSRIAGDVPCQRLDDMLASILQNIKQEPSLIIKLDVEGAEDRVLLGAPRIMAHTRKIVIETHSENLYWKCKDQLQSCLFDKVYSLDLPKEKYDQLYLIGERT